MVDWIPADAYTSGTLILRLTLFLAVAAVVERLCNQRFAAWRNLLWKSVVTGVLLLPVGVAMLPELPIASGPVPRLLDLDRFADRSGAPVLTPIALTSDTGGSESALASPMASASLQSASDTSGPQSWYHALITVYLVGLGASLLHLGLGLLYVGRLRRRAGLLKAAPWHDELVTASVRMGFGGHVRLHVSDEVEGPVQVGLRPPVIIIPARIVVQPGAEAERVAVLTHELCHVRQCDYLFNIIAGLARAVFWFHPLVWYAAERLRTTAEQACDDACVASLGRADGYAETLLNVSALLHRRPLPVGIGMARRGKVASRVSRIADLGDDVASIGRLARALALMVGVSLLGLTATVVPASPAATGATYPSELAPEMTHQVGELLKARAASLAQRSAMSRDGLERIADEEVRQRIHANLAQMEEQRRGLGVWAEEYLPDRDWSTIGWEQRSVASHAYGSFASDAFNKRFIELGLYLADRAFEANPLSGDTYAVKYRMLLPRYAVTERLRSSAIERIILGDLDRLGRVHVVDGLSRFDDATEQTVPVTEQELPGIKDGIYTYAYTALYRWTLKQAYFDSVAAIGARRDLGGQDPGLLFALAQLTTDPSVSIQYLRRFIESTPTSGNEQVVLAGAYQQVLTLAAEHPGVLDDADAQRYLAAWRANLDRRPLMDSPTDQAEYLLVRADYALACRRDGDGARESLAAFRVLMRDSLSPINDRIGASNDDEPWVPYENLLAYELLLQGDLAGLAGDASKAHELHRRSLERVKPFIEGWNMCSEFVIADELKSVRRRLQVRLDDPALKDHFYHL